MRRVPSDPGPQGRVAAMGKIGWASAWCGGRSPGRRLDGKPGRCRAEGEGSRVAVQRVGLPRRGGPLVLFAGSSCRWQDGKRQGMARQRRSAQCRLPVAACTKLRDRLRSAQNDRSRAMPRTLSEQQKAALMAAKKKALNGRSPLEVGQAKARTALQWVYRWGWSSAQVIDELGGGRRGLASRLKRAGMLRPTRTEAGGVMQGVPVWIYTLTPAGVEEVERFLAEPELLPYRRDPYRVQQARLRHDHWVQSLTARALRAGQIRAYQSGAELARQPAPGAKQHDAVWILADGQKMAIEVELSAKWARRLDQFVLGVCNVVDPLVGRRPVDAVRICSDSPAIIQRYRAALQPSTSFCIWAKNSRGKWHTTDKGLVTTSVSDRLSYHLLRR